MQVRLQRCRFDSWVGKISWRRAQQPTPVFLPGESHGQRSLASCSPQGLTELDTTEVTQHTRIVDLQYYASFSCTVILLYICIHAAAAAKLLQSSDCVTPQTAAHQAPPSLGFSRQEYWSGLPFPSLYTYIYIYINISLYIYINIDSFPYSFPLQIT